MATPYKNGTTFPPENEEVGTGPGGGDSQSRVQILLSPEHAEMAYLYDRKKTVLSVHILLVKLHV